MAGADGAVTFLLEKFDNWLTRELNLPENIKEGIKKLKSELEMMRDVFKRADARGEQGKQVQVVWIKQLRNISYEIEDVLDMFAYQNAQQHVPWYDRRPRILGNHSIASLIRKIERNLDSIKRKSDTYLTKFNSLPTTSSDHEAGIASLFTPEADIVGVEEPRKELASWVLDVEQAYRVMFVVGMGGLGKTALVKLVCEQLKGNFDCHVWLTATKSQQAQEILSTMFNKLCSQKDESPSTHSLEDLIDMLKNYLRDKTYLIILDDLWVRSVWESVKHAFPKDNCGRVIITTRRGDIASLCNDNYVDVYKIPALHFEKAQELFQRKSFPQGGTYPTAPGPRLLFENLLRKCEGLPLGIIEIGKLLSNREKSEFELKKLHDSLQIELTSGQLSSITRILLLSYNDLPYHLKCCFLYMSMFSENYFVKHRMLIRLWIAEGFVERKNGKQVEDIGEEYLKELLERNLIQASELDFDGKPRTCRVHNLMHKIALSKSEAENFCTIWVDLRGGISDEELARRLSIQSNKFNMSNDIPCHARTLLASSFVMKTEPRLRSGMKLLKTLHLDGACVDTFPKGIDELLLLKYLCLSNTRIKVIPVTIGRLQLLETLNLKQTFVTAAPNTLSTLKELRHLLIHRYNINCNVAFDAVQGFMVHTEIRTLTNLQKISFVKADRDHKVIQELGNLKELRKLGIIDLPSTSGPFLCETIQKLRNLLTLNMASLQREEVLDIQEISNPPPLLQRLYLKGHLEEIPNWISRLHDLVRVRLRWARLTPDNDPLTILGDLPNLLELQLLDAYTGEQLDFDARKFPKLKILEFEQMENLEVITIDNEALPCLQKFTIGQCEELMIPIGIDKVTQLKELILRDMRPAFVDPLRRNGQMRHLVQHIQKIYSKHLQDWDDLS